MGACRFLNVVLGGERRRPLHPDTLVSFTLPVALIVMLYISAVTLLATGEVLGGNRVISSLVFGALVVVISGVVWFGVGGGLGAPLVRLAIPGAVRRGDTEVMGRVVGSPTAPNVRTAIKPACSR